VTCTGAYASVADFEAKFCQSVNEADRAEICRNLQLAASNIKGALAAQGACDCTFADWALDFVKDLNVVIAAAFFKCRCTNISSDDRAAYAAWATEQLALIRSGELELCEGETGAQFPYTGWADQGTTEWARRDIIVNDILRNS